LLIKLDLLAISDYTQSQF